ncbi:MAG: 50S ribosomal protein L18 [Bacteroidota bacterium]|nr:50S ribosomal protein L18 [Bacteroidota bacterium]
MAFSKESRRNKIRKRIRAKLSGTADIPRLAVFRSNKEIYAQLIDDVGGKTLASASSKDIEGTKIDQATQVGKLISEKSQAAGIKTVVFDRGGYLYHGRIKALAEGARESGLKF